jgi:hypothetical protein
MSGDKLIFDLSNEIEGNPEIFTRKDWINILDNQNQNYNNNQSVIDTSQLSNSNKYMSYREAYLSVPLVLTLKSPAVVGGIDATTSDYVLGLKSWFGNIIHSFTCDMNGTTIIQQTPYINMINGFRLLTSLSYQDIITNGAQLGFYPDDPTSWNFANAPSPFGQGTCNNTQVGVNAGGVATPCVEGSPYPVTTTNTFNSGNGNFGYVKRSTYFNYNPAAAMDTGVAYNTLLSSQACVNIYKSYISTRTNSTVLASGYIQYSIMAQVYLKHVHDFWNELPLVKGTFFKMTMNLNNSSCNFTKATGGAGVALTLNSVQNSVGGVLPFMVSAASIGSGGATLNTSAADQIYDANLSVGAVCLGSAFTGAGVPVGTLSKSIYLYIPSYTFNPVFESAYLSSPVKSVKYTDYYQYQVINIASGQVFNNLLTNGIAGVKAITILPFFSPQAGGGVNPNPNTGLPTGIPVWQSPYDSAGCGTTSPLVALNNFNVVVSGQNAIYNTARYTWDLFLNQVQGAHSVNADLTDGLTSSFINQQAWDMNYCYYHVDISRMLPIEQSVPKSINLIGQNQSGKAIDLYCFISYEVSVEIDILTGARV